MKAKTKHFLSIIILLCIICIFTNNNAQIIKDKKPSIMIDSTLQVPESILTNMPTEQLIQEYLKSRFPAYLFVYGDVHESFTKAYYEFNGLRELLNRKDCAANLVEYYKKMDPEAFNLKWSLAKQGTFSFSFVFIEILLSQESTINKMTRSETKIVLAELLKKNELKIHHPEIFSSYGVELNTYTIAKMLELKGKDNGVSQELLQTPGIKNLLNSGYIDNALVHSNIIQKAKEFLNKY